MASWLTLERLSKGPGQGLGCSSLIAGKKRTREETTSSILLRCASPLLPPSLPPPPGKKKHASPRISLGEERRRSGSCRRPAFGVGSWTPRTPSSASCVPRPFGGVSRKWDRKFSSGRSMLPFPMPFWRFQFLSRFCFFLPRHCGVQALQAATGAGSPEAPLQGRKGRVSWQTRFSSGDGICIHCAYGLVCFRSTSPHGMFMPPHFQIRSARP